jgi:hypothetical protein
MLGIRISSIHFPPRQEIDDIVDHYQIIAGCSWQVNISNRLSGGAACQLHPYLNNLTGVMCSSHLYISGQLFVVT